MLQNYRIKSIRIQELSCVNVGRYHILFNLKYYIVGIIISVQPVIHRHYSGRYANFFKSVFQILCKCGNATLTWRIVSDDSNFIHIQIEFYVSLRIDDQSNTC